MLKFHFTLCKNLHIGKIVLHLSKIIKNKNNMYHFSFELESAVVPATLTIEVSYNAYYEPVSYDHDSIFDVSDESYEVFLENIKITDSIDNSPCGSKLVEEIEQHVSDEISKDFFNNK